MQSETGDLDVIVAVWDTFVDITHRDFTDGHGIEYSNIWECGHSYDTGINQSMNCIEGEYGPGLTNVALQADNNIELDHPPSSELDNIIENWQKMIELV